jgi:hypothetical protein
MLPTFINSLEIDLKTKIEYMYTKKAIILHENDRLLPFIPVLFGVKVTRINYNPPE